MGGGEGGGEGGLVRYGGRRLYQKLGGENRLIHFNVL